MDIRVFASALVLFAPCPAFAQQAADCRAGEDAALVQAVRATDGRSVLLADGREIRLAGIDVPLGGDAPAQASAASLQRLAAGQTFRLVPEGAADRYGRIVANLFRPGDTVPLQSELLREGAARLSGHPAVCRTGMQAAERLAREQNRGLWGLAGHALRPADTGAALEPQHGQFAVAEGKVVSVRRSGGTIYVNFGRRWRESLTVTISAPRERMFAQAGMGPGSLEGRMVRVRGHVEDRNGPIIEALRPEQIEVAGQRD